VPRKRYKRKFRFVIALLEALFGQAQGGEITGVFIVYRRDNGEYDYVMESDDPDDMILEVRTSVIRAVQDNKCPEPETKQ
jgi:hypothetical protein